MHNLHLPLKGREERECVWGRRSDCFRVRPDRTDLWRKEGYSLDRESLDVKRVGHVETCTDAEYSRRDFKSPGGLTRSLNEYEDPA